MSRNMRSDSNRSDDVSSITESLAFTNYIVDDDDDLGGGAVTAPQILHGRDYEKLELLKAYHRVLQVKDSQVVFVHGTSGQGKTSLVDTLREPVCNTNGYFSAGKFFQDSGISEPYSAITAAFSDLCDLVVQSPDFDERARSRIHGMLAQDVHLLSRSINLAPFFSGTESQVLPANDNGKASNFARFRAACKNLLLAMATERHPVVLFLDDVQWMDDGSAKLIDMFLADQDIKNVLFILCYRDEEASAMKGILQSVPPQQERIMDIQLSNLNASNVRLIVATHLDSSTDDIDQLSELALQRTGGNPFFVSLFLETIETEEFLTFQGTRAVFDVEKIRASIMVSESVADLLSKKICRLPDEVRDLLTVASLIGYSFDDNVLSEVPNDANESPSRCLLKTFRSNLTHAMDAGFVERTAAGYYQFTHDKLQTAFQNLVDESARENLHLLIGKTYLAQNIDSSIYNAAVHLNAAPGFLSCDDRWIKLARINLDASRYCQSMSAFDKAVSLLYRGIELLDLIEMKWSLDQFELSLELTESLARMALLVGDFETCSAATREAMIHVDTRERKVRILLINVECRMAKNEMKETIQAATETLSELGVKLPRRATMRHVIFKLMKVKFLMARKTDEDILELPPVRDQSVALILRLLMHITFYALVSDDEETGVYAALHAMDLTLKHGMSTYGAPALVLFGVAILRLGDIERGYQLGRLALTLMGQSASRDADCPTIGFMTGVLRHWKEPLCSLRGPLSQVADAGLENGDIIYGTFCMSTLMSLDLVSGVDLEVIESSLQAQYGRIQDYRQEELLIWIRPHMQFVANFRSSSTDWRQLALLSGDFMNFHEHCREANAAKNIIVSASTFLMRAMLENVFGYHDTARERYDQLESFADIVSSHFAFGFNCWGAAVANYECYRTDGKRKYLRKARRYKKELEKRDLLGPNASTYLVHLNLKEALMRRTRTKYQNDNETLRLVDSYLNRFSTNDGNTCTPCFVVAGALVDAGSTAERMGRLIESEQYFEQAKEIYDEEWGGFAPAAWLEEKCEALRRNFQQETASPTLQSPVGGTIQFSEEDKIIITNV